MISYPEGTVFGLPNCGIIANAYVANVSYNTAWNWFKERNNYRSNWKGRTDHEQYDEFLNSMNIPFIKSQPIKRLNKLDLFGKCLLHVNGHAFVFDKGFFLDQTTRCQINAFKYRNCLVKNLWEIL